MKGSRNMKIQKAGKILGWTAGWGIIGAIFGAAFGTLASFFHGGPELMQGVIESTPAFALMGAVGGFLSSFDFFEPARLKTREK